MEHVKYGCLSILLIVGIGNAFAATYEWNTPSTVDRFYPAGESTPILYLRMTSDAHNPAGCANAYYYALSSSHALYEDYKKMALTAKATGYKLRIGVEKESCIGSYPKVNRMYLF